MTMTSAPFHRAVVLLATATNAFVLLRLGRLSATGLLGIVGADMLLCVPVGLALLIAIVRLAGDG
jgi:hypothetical protein